MKAHKTSPAHGERTASTITWLHLSDFHFRTSEKDNYNSNIVLEALLRDIAERIQQDHLKPDFIVVSGDLAFSGQPEEYKLAQQSLDRLLKVAGLRKERLFLVPGNHDVDRSTISPLTAGVTRLLNDREAVRKLMDNDDDCQLTFKRFQGYQDFITAYLGECTLFDNKRCSYVKQIQIGDLDVAILGLNSAWLSASDEDRNYLIVGERPVRAALGMAKGADLRLAVMHHPFDWLRDFDRKDVEALLCDSCDYILHGHMHQTGLLKANTPDSGAMIIAAGACYETRKHTNSYNFVQLNLATGAGAVHLRKYSDQRGGFWTKDVESYRNVDEGVHTFTLPDYLLPSRRYIDLEPPVIFNGSTYKQPRDVKKVFLHLQEWKIVHTNAQSMLFGVEPLVDAFEQCEQPMSETQASKLERIWFKYCEPKVRKAREHFGSLQVVEHSCIKDILSLLQGKNSVLATIQYLDVNDVQNIKQLQSSIYELTDALKEALILADIYITKIAEYLILIEENTFR